MFQLKPRPYRSAIGLLCFAIVVGTFGLGVVVAQQQAPTTKITPLMKQVIADFPGHEVTMITLDFPPGSGRLPHRHPRHHTFGYVLESTYKIKLDNGPETSISFFSLAAIARDTQLI